MKKLLCLFGVLLVVSNCIIAQQKIFFSAVPTGSNYNTIWSMNPFGGRLCLRRFYPFSLCPFGGRLCLRRFYP